MKINKLEKQIEKEYHVSWYIICYKLFLGITELLFGIGILLFGRNIAHLYIAYARQELSDDPHDILVHLSESIIPQLFTHNTYIIVYLLLLGCAKVAGAIGLMYKQNWGVDLLVGLTIILFPFQLYNVVVHPSLIDAFYIFIGLVISLYLIEFKPRAWISRVAIIYIKKLYK